MHEDTWDIGGAVTSPAWYNDTTDSMAVLWCSINMYNILQTIYQENVDMLNNVFFVEHNSFTIYCFGKGSNMVWLLILLLVKWTFDCSCRPIKLNFPYCGRRSGLIWNLCQLNTLKRNTLFFKEKEKGKIVLFLVPCTSIRVNNLQSLKSISKSYETKI